MIRLLITLCLVLSLVSCTSTPTRPSKKSTSKKSFSSKSAKEEEYKRKIAALDKKIKELEKQKTKPVEPTPSKEVSAPKEESVPQEVSASKKAEEPKELTQRLQTKPIHHIVKKGEWLSTIAKQYQTTTEELLKNNPILKSPDSIKVGQVLLIRNEQFNSSQQKHTEFKLEGSKTVTTVGTAYLGSDITLEEAKIIALTDAQSLALNKLGVFVEASQTVQDFRLTQDEVRSITGAIMKSTVIKEEKKVEDKTFIFYSTVTSEISLDSLREALENYQNRSKDKNLIQQLMSTVKRLRLELAKNDDKGVDELELVDELVFSNQRMNEFLTTRMVIDKEIEIQNIYKENYKIHLKNNLFINLRTYLKKNGMFNSIPTAIKNDLYLKSNDNFNKHVFGHLQQAHKTLSYYEKKYFKYNEHNLKIKPFLNLDIEFIIPVIIHINDKEFKYLIRFRILKDSTNSDVSFKMFCDKNETHNAEFFLWILENSWVLDKYGRSIKTGTGCSYKLNSSYNLNNIKNIKIRYGRFKILNFEIL